VAPDRIRNAVLTAALYGSTGARIAVRSRRAAGARRGVRAGRPVFVAGAPRSGTTFVAGVLGSQPGFVDLGEVKPLKAAVPRLVGLPDEEAGAAVARILELTRRLALARSLRFVEQTPETAFVLGGVTRAYPDAVVLHMLRDGRDVVSSLLERGWLSAGRGGADDARQPYGSYARFWVEPERADEFARASDATRAAWAWRRYVEAARSAGERAVEVRYEALVAAPGAKAAELAELLGVDAAPLAAALAEAHTRSVGRWRRELAPDQLADVEAEAGPLLRELGFDPA
jgi:hypothetical protein